MVKHHEVTLTGPVFSAFVPDCLCDIYNNEGRQYGFPQHAQPRSLAAKTVVLLQQRKIDSRLLAPSRLTKAEADNHQLFIHVLALVSFRRTQLSLLNGTVRFIQAPRSWTRAAGEKRPKARTGALKGIYGRSGQLRAGGAIFRT